MKIKGKAYRTIWLAPDGWSVEIIDQTRLPHELVVIPLQVGGGRRARHPDDAGARRAADRRHGRLWPRHGHPRGCLRRGHRPRRRVPRQAAADGHQPALGAGGDAPRRAEPAARASASPPPTSAPPRSATRTSRPAAASASTGASCIEDIAAKKGKGEKVEVLTHCNAGWLACVDWGTATSPIYQAHDAGVPLHVWVDETRPRNQGAALTAYELGSHGVPHTIVVDNAGGHLMQHGKVDMVIVGTDRVAANGDVANKIGTYLKALAAHDNDVPFYVALPHSTIDWTLDEGLSIPIEERSADEVLKMPGRLPDGTRRHRGDRRARLAGRQPGLRRDAGAARHRLHHRARRLPGNARGAAFALPGAGREIAALLQPL